MRQRVWGEWLAARRRGCYCPDPGRDRHGRERCAVGRRVPAGELSRLRTAGRSASRCAAGGDLAAKQPWRNLLAHCLAFVPDWQQYPETEVVQRQNWPLLATAVSRGINAPRASSCGRLFDAVACALGIETQRYEGEAACRLEALAERCAGVDHPVTLQTDNLALFWQQWLTWRAEPGERAWAFHDALAKGLSELAATHARRRSLTTVCFSGGVLHNRLLRARLRHYLSDFTLLFPSRLPAGDGAISFGQAVVAAARSCSQGI